MSDCTLTEKELKRIELYIQEEINKCPICGERIEKEELYCDDCQIWMVE